MNWSDPDVRAAVIAIIVSLLTTVISLALKSIYDRRFHTFKLDIEHRYDQRKQIKQALSQTKVPLLDACDSLSHRLWNFAGNYAQQWHTLCPSDLRDPAIVKENYYLVSFVYRLAAFLAWVRETEKAMVYLDTTIASQSDLEYVKFLRLFFQVLCDVSLFQGLDYDSSVARDHFFRNKLEEAAESLADKDGICPFGTFQANLDKYWDSLEHMGRFLNGLSPEEERLRWDRLQILHVLLMLFLNSYGYDYQYTPLAKIKRLLEHPRKNGVIPNFLTLLKQYKLDRQREVRKLFTAHGL